MSLLSYRNCFFRHSRYMNWIRFKTLSFHYVFLIDTLFLRYSCVPD